LISLPYEQYNWWLGYRLYVWDMTPTIIELTKLQYEHDYFGNTVILPISRIALPLP